MSRQPLSGAFTPRRSLLFPAEKTKTPGRRSRLRAQKHRYDLSPTRSGRAGQPRRWRSRQFSADCLILCLIRVGGINWPERWCRSQAPRRNWLFRKNNGGGFRLGICPDRLRGGAEAKSRSRHSPRQRMSSLRSTARRRRCAACHRRRFTRGGRGRQTSVVDRTCRRGAHLRPSAREGPGSAFSRRIQDL